MRVKLIERQPAARVERVRLVEPAEGVKLQGELDLDGSVENLYSPWCRGLPPCTGWWDLRKPGGEQERLWFNRVESPLVDHDDDGTWHHSVGERPCLKWHSQLVGVRWRGLRQPWEEGYHYDVPASWSLIRKAWVLSPGVQQESKP